MNSKEKPQDKDFKEAMKAFETTRRNYRNAFKQLAESHPTGIS